MKANNLKRCFSAALCGLFVLTSGISSAIISSAVEDDITVEKKLLDFSDCETGKDFKLPDGTELINGDDGSTYDGTQTVKTDENGNKYLNVAIDKKVTDQSGETVQERDFRIALKVSVPSKYAEYIDKINLEYSNNVEQKNAKTKMYTLLGITNGTDYGKTAENALSFNSGENGKISVSVSDMYKTNIKRFLDSCNKNTEKWSSEEKADISHILVYITMPYTKKANEGWNVGIKGLSIILKGDADTINNIDKVDPLIENFDSYESLDDLKAGGGITIGGRNITLTDKADSSPNALLYKGKGTAGTDYDTYISLKIDRRVEDAKGITFRVRNLDTSSAETLRCFVETKNEKGENKTYQVLSSVPADDGKYRTVRIYFDDIGQKTGDYMWGGTSSGYTMTRDEIKNIYKFMIRIPYMGTHEGVVLDDFYYMLEDDRITRTKTLFNFDNCKAGDSLPDGITKSGTYKGSDEIVTDENGKSSYRINFDVKNDSKSDKINENGYISLTVPIPAGMLYDCAEIRLKVTKKGNTETTVPYLMTVNNGEGSYGKADQSSQHISKTEGDYTLTTSLGGLLKVNNGWNLLNWVNPNGASKWTNDDLGTVKNIVLHIAAPYCDGTEGYYLDIHSVEVFYTELPEYTETETRTVFVAGAPEKSDSETVTASLEELVATDKNFRKFSEKVVITTSDKDNADYVSFVNRRVNFMRSLTDFTETATLFMYAHADIDTVLKMKLVTRNGDEIPFETKLSASADNDFEDIKLSVKEVFEEFYKENPDADFSLDDIYTLEILPVAAKAGKVEISCLTLWSFEVGDVGGSNSWYYYENGVAVEAYNDYLVKTDSAVITSADTADMISEWGIKVPNGLTPVLYKSISLFNANGDTIEPSGNIWLTFDLPDGTDLDVLSLYRVYFDGSILPARYVIEDGKLSINTFQVGGFMIFTGKLGGDVTEEKNEETTDERDETEEQPTDDTVYDSDYNYGNDYTEGTLNSYDSDNTEEEEQTVTQVVRRKKYKRKKNNNSNGGLGVLAWSLIGAGALVVVAGGTVLTVVIVKKKKKGAAK